MRIAACSFTKEQLPTRRRLSSVRAQSAIPRQTLSAAASQGRDPSNPIVFIIRRSVSHHNHPTRYRSATTWGFGDTAPPCPARRLPSGRMRTGARFSAYVKAEGEYLVTSTHPSSPDAQRGAKEEDHIPQLRKVCART